MNDIAAPAPVENADEAATVWQCLEKALDDFNSGIDQKTLLRPRNPESQRGAAASERAIAHRLAFYLEMALRKTSLVGDNSSLVVDCEYNRHGGAGKALGVEKELKDIVEKARKKKWDGPDEDGFYVFSVAPDIVVHERGHDGRNRLIVEVKKATNPETPRYDKLKLELFTRLKERQEGYGYSFGVWVIANDNDPPEARRLHIAATYEKGQPV